jgi:glucose-6-phosphate isomerase
MIEVHYKNESSVDRNSSLYKQLHDAHLRLIKKESTIWGSEAAAEASIRLDWIDLPSQSRSLLTQLDALFAKHRHFTNVILCGMGGSSLGPEVIAQTYGKKLFVLDSTDPNYISHVMKSDWSKTLVIVGSKSGSTIETACQKSFFEECFIKAGLEKSEHMIIVTDPGSPLDTSSREAGLTVVNANPNVGGRFSVLGAFGLLPAALVGIDVSVILDSALDTKESLIQDPHPALLAAYAIITGTDQYFSITDENSTMPGLSDWIEQLVAESTGKNRVGRLPVVLDHSVDEVGGNHLSISFVGNSDLVINGDLGSQFFFWEWITALIGAGLSIDPFNQPNVQESKLASGLFLDQWSNSLPALGNQGLDASIAFFQDSINLEELLASFLQSIPNDGYLGIMAYLDRQEDEDLKELRSILATRISKPVTFGWGPRFLHSTGQFHKGGQNNGSFLLITGDFEKDHLIPGKKFTFGTLIMAQAIGDQKALESRGLQTVRLHLLDRKSGIKQLLEVAKKL